MRLVHMLTGAAMVLLPIATALASETATYRYDAKGRLTQVTHAGGPSNGVGSTYSFDRADNRVATATAGAWLDAGARPVVVMPIAGMTVLPLPANH